MVLKLSGSESVFQNQPWATFGKRSNNCYDYAIGNYESYRPEKSSPGNRADRPSGSVDCKQLAERVLLDNPGRVYRVDPETSCRKGYYKIMMVTTGPSVFNMYSDFHFYKQHGKVQYRIKKSDTAQSIAKFFKVPTATVGPVIPGKRIIIKKNLWSHKRGWGTGPLLADACGKIINDPRKACRNYDSLKYTKVCGSFCVKNSGVKSGKSKPKVSHKFF
jgi:hypothetical protein